MKFTLALEIRDYFNFQLYYFSENSILIKKKKKNFLLMSILFLLLSVLLFAIDIIPIAIGTLIMGVFYIFFYLFYYQNAIKKNLEKTTIEAYKNKVGKKVDIEFNENEIKTASAAGYSTIYISDLEKIIETPDYFYPKFTMIDTLIIPKSQIADVNETRKFFQIYCHSLGIEFSDELNWKWKL